jgi:hypothetical protein
MEVPIIEATVMDGQTVSVKGPMNLDPRRHGRRGDCQVRLRSDKKFRVNL